MDSRNPVPILRQDKFTISASFGENRKACAFLASFFRVWGIKNFVAGIEKARLFLRNFCSFSEPLKGGQIIGSVCRKSFQMDPAPPERLAPS